MGLETGTYISDLNASNPVGATDPKSQGDNHIRLIKATILATFPNISGAMTLTHTQLNNAAIKTESNIFTGDPSAVLRNTGPQIRFEETDATANAGNWMLAATGEQFELRAYNDAYSDFDSILTVARSGATAGAVSIYHGDAVRISTDASAGVVNLHSSGNTDAEVRALNLTHADGTDRATLGFISSDVLQVYNRIHGANVLIQGEQAAAGAVVNLALFDPDGAASLYYDGNLALRTRDDGIDAVGSVAPGIGGTQDSRVVFYDSALAAVGEVGFTSSANMALRSYNHGGNVVLQGEDVGGTNRNLVVADPDGAASLYYAGALNARTGSESFEVHGNGTDNPFLSFYRADNSTRNGFIWANTSSGLRFRNEIHGTPVILEGEDAGGTLRTLINADPDGAILIYENETNNEHVARSKGRTGDASSAFEHRHRNGSFYDTGFNQVPQLSTLDSGNLTLSVSNIGLMCSYNTATARSLFANNDSNIKAGSMWSLIVGPSAGTLTLDAGTGVTIRYWDGSAWADTSAGGTVTAGEGQYTIWKETDTLYWVSGPGLS